MVGCLSAASIAIATVYVLVLVLFLVVFGLLVFGLLVLWDDFVLVLFFFVDAKFFLQVVWRVGVGLCVRFALSKASHLKDGVDAWHGGMYARKQTS